MNKKAEKNMPVSEELERSILACILLDTEGDCYLQASQRITAEDFGLDSSKRIFRAMQHLVENAKAIDYFTLAGRLQDTQEIDQCGGVGYVTDLAGKGLYPRLKNIGHYLDNLLEYSSRRTIIYAATAAIDRAYEADKSGDVAGELQQSLDLVTQRAQSQTCVPASVIGPVVAQQLVWQNQQGMDFIGLPTGIRKLDRLISGLVAKEDVVVAADTGAGKTSFALNVTEINCLDDNPVQFFSLEMGKESLYLRLAASLANINHLKLRNGSWLQDDELDLAMQAITQIMKWPLWIDDTGGLTPRELYARGRMQVAKGAKLIIVDYLQKIAAPGKSLYERVTNASEAVRVLAKESGVPVLNLSQLSRPEKGAKKRKPTMHDLRESGAIEQDAHSVILLWREESENSSGEPYFTENDLIIVGKNRNGPTGEIRAKYNRQIMKWVQDDSDLYDGKASAAHG